VSVIVGVARSLSHLPKLSGRQVFFEHNNHSNLFFRLPVAICGRGDIVEHKVHTNTGRETESYKFRNCTILAEQ